MLKRIRFAIKGSFYYDAPLAFKDGKLLAFTPLQIRAEPQNGYDVHALQIWCGDDLLGYVPRRLAHHFPTNAPQITLIQAQQHGHFLWLECELEYHCSFLEHLKLLWLSTITLQLYRLKLRFHFFKRPRHDARPKP